MNIMSNYKYLDYNKDKILENNTYSKDYYKKYIKYKNKYLNAKNQIGGALGVESCPKEVTEETKKYSVCHFLRTYNCVFNQINKHISEKLAKFDNIVLELDNRTNDYKITVKDLKVRSFTIDFLKSKFPLSELKIAGFPLFKLWEKGFPLSELKAAGFTTEEFRNAGFINPAFLKTQPLNIREELSKILNDPSLIQSSPPLSQPRVDKVITVDEIKQIIIKNNNNNEKIKEELAELNRGRRLKIELQVLINADVKLETLLMLGYDQYQLKEKFSIEDFKNVSNQSYVNPTIFNFIDLINAKYPLKLLFYHFDKIYFKDIKIKELVESGIDLIQFLRKGYSLAELTDFFCFTLFDIDPNLEEYMILNISEITPELKERDFTVKNLFNQFKKVKIGEDVEIKKIKKYQVNLSQLLILGFTIEELKDLPNSALILRKKGYKLQDFKNAGFSISSLKNATYNVKELKEAGFTAKDLKYDYTILELKEAGFTAEELKEAKFDIILFYILGFSMEKITELFEEKYLCRLELYKQYIKDLKKLINDYEIDKQKEKEIEEIIKKIENFHRNFSLVGLFVYKKLNVPINLLIKIFDIENLKYIFSLNEFLNLNVDREILNDSYSIFIPEDEAETSYTGKKFKIKNLMIIGEKIEEILKLRYSIENIKETLDFYFYNPKRKMNYLNPEYKIFINYANEIKLNYQELE